MKINKRPKNDRNLTVEFADFGAKMAAVVDDVKSGRSSVSGLTSSVENAEKMIEALNKDFQGLKKKIAAK